MTAYEQQIQDTGRYYDQIINSVELDDYEILASYVPNDHVHEKIHNPTQEGIDEG